MKFTNLIFLILILSVLTSSAFAVMDPAAKEETTPLAPEAAITPEQIPPITQVGRELNPAAPASAPGQRTTDATSYSAADMEVFAQ